MERQWVAIQMFPGRNPLIFCSQLVSIFPSWDELCFSLSKFFVLGLNQHCILNRLLCLHFKSPLGCYPCYLDGFYSMCCARWLHQNECLSGELDIKQPYLWMHKYGCFVSQYFFLPYRSDNHTLSFCSAFHYREAGDLGGLLKCSGLKSLTLVEWCIAFCLLSGSSCDLHSPRRRGIGLGGHEAAEFRMSFPGGCQVKSRRQTTNPYWVPGIVWGAFCVLCSINKIATRKEAFQKQMSPATKRQFVHTQD